MTGGAGAVGWMDPRWHDASWAAALFAVDPVGTGVALRALAGTVRVRWLKLLRGLLPEGPVRTIPLNIPDARLLGGLDPAATLQAGRPIAERGILAEADGGVVLLAMAERLSPGTAARVAAVMDQGTVAVARDGPVQLHPARIGVVAIDEGMADDERSPAALRDRLAFAIDLADVGTGTAARLGVVTLSGAVRRGAWRRRGLFRVGHRPAPASLPIGSSPTMLRSPILRQSRRMWDCRKIGGRNVSRRRE